MAQRSQSSRLIGSLKSGELLRLVDHPRPTLQVDFLPRKIAVNVERARIEEIPRRPSANERFDAVARAKRFRDLISWRGWMRSS